MKILLVPENPGWAFDNRAKDLMTLGMSGIDFSMKYRPEVKASDKSRYDIIYPMSLSIARKLNDAGIPYSRMAAGITSIPHRKMRHHRLNREFVRFVKRFRGINAWSDEIVDIFKPHCKIYKTRVGIDHHTFKPRSTPKKNGVFTVGWVGRIDIPSRREVKGYDIMLSALKNMDVKLEIRTFKENYVPREKMVGFYQGLDCYICSSRSEGLPNPLLEAAACGVPTITTKVGIVPELIRHRHNGIIVSRTSQGIRRAVRKLMKRPSMQESLRKNIRKTITDNWTWDICKKDWETFFKSL
jgi:glycosyltransferase involved in cell wall biosynthesis